MINKELIRSALREELRNQHEEGSIIFWVADKERWAIEGVIDPNKLVDRIADKLEGESND